MKFTFSWLKEHLDTKASLDDVARRLTMTGLEVDKIHDRAKDLEGFVVGRVVEAKSTPTPTSSASVRSTTGLKPSRSFAERPMPGPDSSACSRRRAHTFPAPESP